MGLPGINSQFDLLGGIIQIFKLIILINFQLLMNFHQFKTKYLLKIAMRNFPYLG